MASASLVDQGCSKERLIEKIGGQTIECGSDYLLADVGENNVPFVEYSAAKEDKLYTVVMIDPDAPSKANPKFRSWLHYLAVNVKGGDLKDGVCLSDLQTEIMEYNAPTPPKGTGLHRYIIYVMEQDSRSTLEKGSIKKRKSFDIDEFVKTNNLGNLAVASNMFKTQTN